MHRKKRQRLTLETIRRIRKCYEKNMSAKEIADYIDLTLRATYNVMDKIQNNVLDEDMISSPKNKRKSSESLIKTILSGMLIKNDSLKQAGMAIELKKYNLNKSQPTVARMLQSMGYTRKRLVLIPEDRNSEKNIGERKNFALNIDFVSDNNLVFLDETGVNLHQSRKYGYSGKNSKAVKTVKNSRGKNISCMVAIKKSGIVAFKILENAFDGDKFISFINEYLVPHFNAEKMIF